MSKHKRMQEYIHLRMELGRGVALSAIMVTFQCGHYEAKAALYTYRNMYPTNCLSKSTSSTLYPVKRGFGRKVNKDWRQRCGDAAASLKFQKIEYSAVLLSILACCTMAEALRFMIEEKDNMA